MQNNFFFIPNLEKGTGLNSTHFVPKRKSTYPKQVLVTVDFSFWEVFFFEKPWNKAPSLFPDSGTKKTTFGGRLFLKLY